MVLNLGLALPMGSGKRNTLLLRLGHLPKCWDWRSLGWTGERKSLSCSHVEREGFKEAGELWLAAANGL